MSEKNEKKRLTASEIIKKKNITDVSVMNYLNRKHKTPLTLEEWDKVLKKENIK